MKRSRLEGLLAQQTGFISAHPYDTAWVSLVPDINDPTRPAWPQALQYLYDTQLADGGWGHQHVYYAHGRTISTVAALWALLAWGHPKEEGRIEAGVNALHEYAARMMFEPYEPVGFELLLPRLVEEVKQWSLNLPLVAWAKYEKMAAQKMALIGRLQPDYDSPRPWWFSMEMLSQKRLAEIDDRILNAQGSVATAPAATAAYLRAKRLNGQDAPQAAAYLDEILQTSKSGVGFCHRLEQFEIIWTLDILRRAGIEPSSPYLAPYLHELQQAWQRSPRGMSWSDYCPIADGDLTAVSYTLLSWAGLQPDDRPFQRYWGSDYYLNYPDELIPSISANIHALAALHRKPNDPHYRSMAERITRWLNRQMAIKGQFHDKWHFSPLYATSRAISVLAGLDDALANKCLEYLLQTQDESGGWGQATHVNLEETSYATLGLVAAYRAGLLQDGVALKRAGEYLKKHAANEPVEAFWIGKTLFQPVGLAHAYIYGAQIALQKLDRDQQRPSSWHTPPIIQQKPLQS